MTPGLPEQLVALHEALAEAGLPHAFGGAIALAYYTEEPRGTRDLDVNIFVDQADAPSALEALPPEIDRPALVVEQLVRDGQGRLFWGETPIDLFFDTVEFHVRVRRGVRWETFMGTSIPILGPVELVVFKAAFDRTKDWADIEAVVANEAVDVDAVRAELIELVGPGDPRLARLGEAVARARRAG